MERIVATAGVLLKVTTSRARPPKQLRVMCGRPLTISIDSHPVATSTSRRKARRGARSVPDNECPIRTIAGATSATILERSGSQASAWKLANIALSLINT